MLIKMILQNFIDIKFITLLKILGGFKMKKRFVGLFLILCILVTMIPLEIAAEENMIFDAYLDHNQSDGYNKVKKDGKFGFVDEYGDLQIPCCYEDATDFHNGYAFVKNNDKWGLIDKQGNIIIDFVYDGTSSSDGNAFNEGYASVKSNDKWGVIDVNGKLIVPFLYDYIFDFQYGYAVVKKNNTYNLIDSSGATVLKKWYDNLVVFRQDNIIFLIVKNQDKYGCIDINENTIIPFKYDILENLHAADGYMFHNEQNPFTPTAYNVLVAKIGNNRGIIDLHDETIIPFEYRSIRNIYNKENGIFAKDSLLFCEKSLFPGEKIIINGENTEIFSCGYTGNAENFNEGLGSVDYNDSNFRIKTSFINSLGAETISHIYDDAYPFKEGLAAVKKDEKWGYINSSGITVIPFIYDEATMFDNGRAIVAQNRLRGVIDKNGNIVIPCEHKNIFLYDNYAIINDDGFDVGIYKDKKFHEYIVKFDNVQKPISVYLNDKKIKFDVSPTIENGRTLVPVRAIFEEMGMSVSWDADSSTVTATGNGNAISMRINEKKATVNGKTYFTDVPARIIEGRTVVPIRFISESLDTFVEWNPDDRVINISDRVYFFIKFNNPSLKALLSNDYTFNTWYQYYLDSILNNKSKWASASIIKFWTDPFTYWSEVNTKKITTAVLIDSLTNDAAISSIEQTANDFFIQSLNEDIDALEEFMCDKGTDFIGESAEEIDANLLKLQGAKSYINSNKDLSKLTPEQLNIHNDNIRDYHAFINSEIASEEYKKMRLEKLDSMLTKAGIVCDVASLANAGIGEYNTIKALVYTKNYYNEGLDLIYENLSNTGTDKYLKDAIIEVKSTMNQSMIDTIQQCVTSIGVEFLDTSIAETIAKEFVVPFLKVGTEKFLVKAGVDATKAATITMGIGKVATGFDASVTTGQVTTAVCDVVLSTGSGIDASYDLKILMEIEQRISSVLNNYILALTNKKNTIKEIAAITTVLKAIRLQASLLTNVIYNSDHNSLVDKGFRLIFTDRSAYDDTYDSMYEMEINRIKNINFINY